MQRRAASAGFDWLDAAGPLAKVREEADELEAELGDASSHARRPSRRRASSPRSATCSSPSSTWRGLSTSTRSWRCGRPRHASSTGSGALMAGEDRLDWRALGLEEQDRYYRLAKELA